MSVYFPVLQEHLDYFISRDKHLAEAIALIGPIRRIVRPGAFQGLIHTICGQQISAKAHQSIWQRICERFSMDNAQMIASASVDDLRACGLSGRKAMYIRNIAQLFAQGALSDRKLKNMPDDELRAQLLALPGVGSWTVDMLLIFTFLRRNILSRGDLGIQKGLRMLYGLEQLNQDLFDQYHDRFSPLASIASFYLWEIASGKYPQWSDPRTKKKDQAQG